MNEHFFIYNSRFFKEGTSVITPDNHSFRYGDGLFETIRAESGKLLLEKYHFERFFFGLQILGFDIPHNFTSAFFKDEIIRILKKNRHDKYARIRLMIFRSDGSLDNPKDHFPNYIIQTWALPNSTKINEPGLFIDIYTGAKKSCDTLANLKTNNFLPYALAALHAKKNNFDDCILLNSLERICDTSVANIFIIKNKKTFTPPLTEGCIAGVMRRWIIEKIKIKGNTIIEKPLSIEELKQADEVFLTNSIHLIQWVKQFQNIQYTNKQVRTIYDELSKTFLME